MRKVSTLRSLAATLALVTLPLGGCGLAAANGAFQFSATARDTAPLDVHGRVQMTGLTATQIQALDASDGHLVGQARPGADGQFDLDLVVARSSQGFVIQAVTGPVGGKALYLAAPVAYPPASGNRATITLDAATTVVVGTCTHLAGLTATTATGCAGQGNPLLARFVHSLDASTMARLSPELEVATPTAGFRTADGAGSIDALAEGLAGAISTKAGQANGLSGGLPVQTLEGTLLHQAITAIATGNASESLSTSVPRAETALDAHQALDDAITTARSGGAPLPAALYWRTSTVTSLSPILVLVDPASAGQGGNAATTSVLVSSAESDAVPVTVAEIAPGSGIFEGQAPLRRLYDDYGRQRSSDGHHVLVNAEGTVTCEGLVARYQAAAGALTATTTYCEPGSTLTSLLLGVDGTPIAGAKVYLPLLNGGLRGTTSRPDGSYAFHDVPPGTYVVSSSTPQGPVRTRVQLVDPSVPTSP